MSDLCRLIWSAVFALFRSRAALHAEILFLRHQLNVLHRRSPKRVALSNIDRLVFAGLYCLAPQVLDALKILKPETMIRWHRAGFRAYWRWRSRPHGGRSGTPHRLPRRSINARHSHASGSRILRRRCIDRDRSPRSFSLTLTVSFIAIPVESHLARAWLV
jgi:hypothetical protein